MKRFAVLARNPNAWCFDHGIGGHKDIFFVVAHDAKQAMALIAHDLRFQEHDYPIELEAFELAATAGRRRKQTYHAPVPDDVMTIGPDSLCMCAYLKAKGLRGSCQIHQ